MEKYLLAVPIIAFIMVRYWSKKKNEQKEVGTSPDSYDLTDGQIATHLNTFEPVDSFSARCKSALTSYLNSNNIPFYRHQMNYRIEFVLEDGYNFTMETSTSFRNKCIKFESIVSTYPIPNHRLQNVAELVNRYNSDMMFNPCALNYLKREVSFTTYYHVGNSECSPEMIGFYINYHFNLREIRDALIRVVDLGEDPVTASLGFTGRENESYYY